MPELLTLQDLANGHLDVKALGEAANGDENTIVTTRTGNTYPSAERAINIMFKNGGLPAEPFATKALMTASALVDGKYAQVTEDTVNNGLYIKKSGVWVKSGYDSLDRITKIEKDLLVVEKNYSIAPVTFKEGVALSNSTGSEVTDVSWQSSNEYVPVKAGDFVVLKNLKRGPQTYAVYAAFTHFAIYGTDKTFKYSSGVLNIAPESSSERDNRLLADPYLTLESSARYNTGIKITEDGFIKVSCLATLPTDKKVEVLVVNKNKFMELVLGIHDKQTYSDFLDVSVQAQPSQNLSGKGFVFHNKQVVGTKTALTADAFSNVTQAVPVKKGQFITVQGHRANRDFALLILEDSQGNFLQVVDVYDAYNLVNWDTTRTILNYEVPFDCYARFSYRNHSIVPFMYAIHNSKFNVEYPYLDNETKLNFYEGGTYNPAGYNLITARIINADFGLYSRFQDTATVRSVAYTLKKGDVLEYELDSTGSPYMALVTGHRDFRDVSIGTQPGSFITLTDNTLITLDVQDLLLADPSTTKQTHYVNGKKGIVYYCNDESDSTIIFLRPRKSHEDFTTFGLSDRYTLNILTKEEYKAKRDKFLSSRLSSLSSMRAGMQIRDYECIPERQAGGSVGSVLMFKGEILHSYVGNKFDYVTQYLSKNELGNTVGNANSGRAYTNLPVGNYASVPMSDADPRSGKYVDILVRDTCILTPVFSVKDVDDLSIRLVDRNYLENKQRSAYTYTLDENRPLETAIAFGYKTENYISPVNGDVKLTLTGNEDSFYTFVPKGSYVKVTTILQYKNVDGFILPLKDATGNYVASSISKTPFYSDDTVVNLYENFSWESEPRYNTLYKTPTTIVKYIEEDSLVIFNQNKKVSGSDLYNLREPVGGLADIFAYTDETVIPYNIVLNSLINKNYKPSIETLTQAEYEDNYKVTDKTLIHIPDTKGITFNFLEVVGTSLVTANYGVLQIKQNGRVVAVVAAKTENQGQSSANYARKNINIEFLNSEGDDVYIKFGSYPEEAEVVLKSYLLSDKGNFKDSISAEIWHEVRNQSLTRIGGAFPDSVFSDLNKPYNQVARGTTFGFPVLMEFNGNLYSTATARNKKKRENYAMEKNNRDHILMQVDYQAMGVINWSTVQFGNFEIRNPKISGYTVGDKGLPATHRDVEDSINRIINYMKECSLGTTDVATTYADYIHLDSFIDYAICVNLLDNWDGISNNFLLGTQDSTLWSVYQYDTDKTLGGRGIPTSNPFSITLTGNNFFNKVAQAFPALITQRYKYLRDTGLIDANRYKAKIKDMVNTIPVEAKEVDAINWGAIFESAGAPHSMDWIAKRISHLDLLYNYLPLDEEVYVYSTLSTGSVAANSTKEFNFTGTKAIPGVALLVEVTNLPNGLTAIATCIEAGKIKLTITNSTSTALASSNSTLKIKRGV